MTERRMITYVLLSIVLVPIEHIRKVAIAVLVVGCADFGRPIIVITSEDLARGHICLTRTHDFTTHHDWSLPTWCAALGAQILFLLLAFKDHLLLLCLLLLMQLLLCFEGTRACSSSIVDIAFAACPSQWYRIPTAKLTRQILIVDGLGSDCSRVSLHDSISVALPRETFNLSFDGFVDEVLILGIFVSYWGATTLTHAWSQRWDLLALIDIIGLSTSVEVIRLELLTLIELVLMEVSCILVNRLRSLLILSRHAKAQVFGVDRVSARVKLLDSLGEVSVLGVASQHCGLVELVTAVLDGVHLHSDLNSGLLQVCVGSDSHLLSGSDLTILSCEFLVLLILSHCLVDVSLHELVLLFTADAFGSPLSGVSDTFDCLALLSIQCRLIWNRFWIRKGSV